MVSSDEGPLISCYDSSTTLGPLILPNSGCRSGRWFNSTTVVIDPGHGGNDHGASGPEGTEDAYALDTAQRLRAKLEEFGIKAVLARTDDQFLSLKERIEFSANQPNTLFISLHFNSGPPEAKGFTSFHPAGELLNSNHLAFSLQLAAAVHANCLYKLRSTDGGIHTTKFTTSSSQTLSPAIHLECGYLSHPEEGARIATETYRQQLADAIAGGVRNYQKAIQ